MVLDSIKKAYNDAPKRGWDTLYFFFDIHATIFEPDYNNSSAIYYPLAKETLQLLSNYKPKDGEPKLVLSLYTCSHPDEVERYQTIFRRDNINFKYVNVNPEVPDTALGCYTQKPYYNVIFEDKASFRPNEWEDVIEWFVDKWDLIDLAGCYIGDDIPGTDSIVGHQLFYNKIVKEYLGC